MTAVLQPQNMKTEPPKINSAVAAVVRTAQNVKNQQEINSVMIAVVQPQKDRQSTLHVLAGSRDSLLVRAMD